MKLKTKKQVFDAVQRVEMLVLDVACDVEELDEDVESLVTGLRRARGSAPRELLGARARVKRAAGELADACACMANVKKEIRKDK